MTKVIHTYLVIIILLFYATHTVVAQDENVYNDMSLEELGKIDLVVTASKKLEDLFEAPLSVTIIKREDIEKSGALSIPEALRFAPGLIVREQSSGIYDVHIRGFDNVTVNSTLPFPANTITLVMIDNRVVYNYFSGGTFWETLPIGISDIERIEIVRGPASALYGPNAVAGVINILTSKPDKDGLNVRANIDGGSYGTQRANATIGYKVNHKMSLTVSGNTQTRDRYHNDYYHWNRYEYDTIQNITSMIQPDLKLTERPGVQYSDPSRAIDRYGLNTYLKYSVSPKTSFELASGYQKSDTQKIYVNNFATPFTENTSQTRYYDVKAKSHGFIGQFSYVSGDQGANEPLWKYDFNTLDALVEYAWSYKNLDIRPGFSHRVADYDGEFIGENKAISSTAYSLLANYLLTLKLRLIASMRVDKFNFSNDYHFTYELGTTYRINKNNLLRLVQSRAKRAPFMVDTYMNLEIPQELATLRYFGNKKQDLLTSTTVEAGWRTKLSPGISLDFELFRSELDNFSDLLYDGQKIENDKVFVDYRYQKVEYSATQTGMSLSADYNLKENARAILYGTLQRYDFETDNENNANATYSVNESTTPGFWGGLTIKYTPCPSLNINLDTYHMGKQEYNGMLGKQTLPSFVTMNGKMSYTAFKMCTPYISVRNILGQHREYGFADNIERTYVIGLHYHY